MAEISRNLSFHENQSTPSAPVSQSDAGGIDTKARLGGYFSQDWKIENVKDDYVDKEAQKVILRHAEPSVPEDQKKSVETGITGLSEYPEYVMHDARVLQKGDTSPEAAQQLFLDKGFALMKHETKVTHWSENYLAGYLTPWGNDIGNVYAGEIEEIIRNVLLVDYEVIHVDAKPGVLKRGPGSKNNFYGTGVHQDYSLTLEDYKDNTKGFDAYGNEIKVFDEHFNKPECTGFAIINFWRPVEMTTPLLDKPLACLDPSTLSMGDLICAGFDTKAIGGTGSISNQMSLKYNPEHKWYYYSKQTVDEVLIFKQFGHWKGEPNTGIGPAHWKDLKCTSVFHTAFVDPNTPEGTPPRTSTEYRVPVWIGKKRTPEEKAAASPVTMPPKGSARCTQQ